MKSLRKFVLPLAAVFFGLLLVPQSGLAQAVNCPTEPTQTTINDGEVYAGPNCTLKSAGDNDSFVFSGNTGETYQLAIGLSGSFAANICLTVHDPSLKVIYGPVCTGVGFGGPGSVVPDLALTVTGTYTMDVSETNSATQNYAVSLERLFPFPPNAVPVQFATLYAGSIFAPTDSNAFTFQGATTGEYEASASLTGSVTANICMTVYSPTGTLITPTAGTEGECTGVGFGGPSTIKIDFTPTATGNYMAFISAAGNDAIQTYSLEVSCLAGSCPMKIPLCTLKDSLSYDPTTSTLTMKFTVENRNVVTWNAWLTYQSTMTNVLSVSQPITTTPVVITKTASVGKEGTVGVLTTFTTPGAHTKGIICFNYAQFNTGVP